MRCYRFINLGQFLIIAGLISSLAACDRSDPITDKQTSTPAEIKSIQVTPEEIKLAAGQTYQLSVILGDAAGNMLSAKRQSIHTIADSKGRGGRIVTWSSSDPSVVQVDNDGVVTALAGGAVKVTATSEGMHQSVNIFVSSHPVLPLSISPISAALSAGESFQLTAILQDEYGTELNGPIIWSSNQLSCAKVNQSGLVTALEPGEVVITARSGALTGESALKIHPVKTISGLDFPGSAGVHKTMRFKFSDPLSAYPATYIWRAYPRQQPSYYTAFFWGNNNAFYSENTYYGFHPYPDWSSENQHFWEIAAPPGGDFLSKAHVIYDRWYIQVAVCRQEGSKTIEELYWDWPDTRKVVRHIGEKFGDPPMPTLTVGDAPWNQGNEAWDGVIRGFQFYDVAMTPDEIAKEINSPGVVQIPWYLNLDPTPNDISDKSGNGHHPSWVGFERPAHWRGIVLGEGVVRTTVLPR